MGRTYEETGLVRAQAKWVRSSARKARIVLEHIRGLSVADANRMLQFSTRDVSRDIQKVLLSAAANATANHGLDGETLVVAEAFADEAVTIKRFKPRARGRAMRVRKRTSHITILLKGVEPAVVVVEEPAVEAKPKRKRATKPKAAAAAPAAGAAEEQVVEEPDAAATAEPAAEADVVDAPVDAVAAGPVDDATETPEQSSAPADDGEA